jgi:hypothetical protein
MLQDPESRPRRKNGTVKPVYTNHGEEKAKSPKLNVDDVIAALHKEHGFFAQAALLLGVKRGVLRHFVDNNVAAAAALKDARAAMGDLAERKLYDLINEGHFPAIWAYLTTMCKDRGYVPAKGAAMNLGETTNVMIGSVNIVAVPSGQFVEHNEPELAINNESNLLPA